MQIRNNYDKEVFNGDIGRIIRIDTEMQELTVLGVRSCFLNVKIQDLDPHDPHYLYGGYES